MANLPEKNITLVDKITSIPSNSNLFLNADGEFRQASVNDVIKSATVVSDTVNNAINDAMQDSIDSHFKQATGSPILLTDTADGTLIDFKGKGRSTQNGTPTPDSPIAIKSVADGGYFDGELLQGVYSFASGVFSASSVNYVCSKNPIPCNPNDKIVLKYDESVYYIGLVYYDENLAYVGNVLHNNKSEINVTVPSNAKFFCFNLGNQEARFDLANAKHITVTINGKYALIVKSKGKNFLENTATTLTRNGLSFTVNNDKSVTVKGTSTTATAYTIGTVYCSADISYKINKQANQYYYGVDGTINYVSSESTPIFTPTVDRLVTVTLYFNGNATVDTTFYPMVTKAEVTDATYEPYKETVTYIPLNEPLRSSLDGSVTDVASLDKVTRKFAKIVIDGVNCKMGYANSNIAYLLLANLGTRAICSHFTYNSNHNIGDNTNANTYLASGEFAIRTTVHDRIYFKKSGLTTVDEWNTWLQANPITVQYELAEPITETIEPVDIVTYDNVTYLTASDNAEMELEYPTSKVAGIASIGYSKGRKAEYEVELLKAQLLELQTAMVNSL